MPVPFNWSRLTTITAPALLLIALVAPSHAQGFKLAMVPDSTIARFTTQETFVGVALPFEPVGETKSVTGGIFFDAAGKLDPKQSKIVVNLATLKTDQANRDRQIRTQSLETDKYPNAELVVTALNGLASPLPMNGNLTFTLVGDLTMHGVTKPTTWTVTAVAKDGHYVGKAKTTTRFDLFNIKKPTFAAKVLSIVDEVRLELEFNFVRTK